MLRLQDHFEAWQFIAGQKGRPEAIHRRPTLLDWPFFYWYQMAAIILSVLVTLAVYQKTRG